MQSITWHDCAGLEHALDDAESIVEGAVHLVKHVVVGAAQQHSDRARVLAASDHDHIIIRNRLLSHLPVDAIVRIVVQVWMNFGVHDCLGGGGYGDALGIERILSRRVLS